MAEAVAQAAEICHVEIPAKNLDQAKDFYSSVFNWEVQKDIPSENYWFFKAGSVGGGFSGGEDSISGGVNLCLKVEDITSKLEEIVAAGGEKLSEKTEIGGGHGFCALFKDPLGNKLTLWSKD